MKTTPAIRSAAVVISLACVAALVSGCGRPSPQRTVIQCKGSDTMVNVVQTWAEEYKKVEPAVDVEVSGGGSGQGIAALIRGTIDIANCSRNMKPEEIAQATKNTGKVPREWVVGFDALAVFVHKDNPIEEITFDQLAGIFAEGGTTTRWSGLGVKLPGASDDEIIRVSRQSSSGTYEFFREHVLGKRDFKLGSRDMNGSKEVVELVGSTPTSIGYSGMGYATSSVKMLRVSSKAGEPAVAPTVENTLKMSYPISRSLLSYTLGEPEGAVRQFLDWVLSDAGQKLVESAGFVPVPPEGRKRP